MSATLLSKIVVHSYTSDTQTVRVHELAILFMSLVCQTIFAGRRHYEVIDAFEHLTSNRIVVFPWIAESYQLSASHGFFGLAASIVPAFIACF